MKFTVLTLFPDIVETYFSHSIMKKAVDDGIISYAIVNIRDYALDKHKRCDDEPYGGGYGMLLKPEPLALALDEWSTDASHVIFPTPSAPLFTQKDAITLSEKDELIFICGRYEGIDQRIIDIYVDEIYSIGAYVLSSGEVASLTMIDCIYRLVEGVIRRESLHEESYADGLLEYPQYTRPSEFRGYKVPDVLLSGDHKAIKAWRKNESEMRTRTLR